MLTLTLMGGKENLSLQSSKERLLDESLAVRDFARMDRRKGH